ncbi:Phosphatidylinositol 3-kinase catalytic subunit type 3 [Danaus plexippus plexippus]|uniref:Phosphatidylinositol 3-kinase catalytic subunit type 3 n=1 Tax=Danaus plexippus plexippus TaxID=278856 RepID=A0A212EIU4_DANPL|nr:Phosphatidylinositol 3-kinase catalytic subunit type 3 [Danaus plexippus plexippus]
MGVVSMPSFTDYWSLRYRYKLVAGLMPLKRYQQIRRFLHFVDNNVQDSDRYYKVWPLVQKIRDNCLAQENERRFSIDEMMIPYKGTKAGKRRQYICLELFYILREDYGIFGLGTIRNNRLRGAEAILPSEKQMKKEHRGCHAQVSCDKNGLKALPTLEFERIRDEILSVMEVNST